MINNDRIVPIQRKSLLDMVNFVLTAAGVSHGVITDGITGEFTVTGSGDIGNKLANEPVKKLDFASGVTAGVIYFVADFDYDGFYVAGTKVTTTGAEVANDAVTVYTATLSGGGVAIAELG